METPEGRKRVWNALSLCLQVEEQGLLKGDLNLAQIAAMSVCRVYYRQEESVKRRAMIDVVDDIVELYLKLNFPQAYDGIQRQKAVLAASAIEERPDQSIVAENMSQLYEKILAMEG